MDKIGIGVIGWGFMGRTHALSARTLPLFYPGCPRPELVSVATRRKEAAFEACEDAGFIHATDDWRELIARDDVQAVSICTPNNMHEEMAVAALQAGKHVYIDKPLSVDVSSAKRICEVGNSSNSITQMAFHIRFFPCVMRAKQIVVEGRLGNIISFRVTYLHSGSVDPKRPASWKSDSRGAGVMLDLGSHALDTLEYLSGNIAYIQNRNRTLYTSRPAKAGGTIDVPGEDACFMLVELENGAVGTLEVSKIATGALDDFSIQIEGDKGALRVDLTEPNFLYFFDNTKEERPLGGDRGWLRIETAAAYPPPGGVFLPSKNSIGWVRAHIACYYNFIKSIVENTPASPSLMDGLRVQCLMDAAVTSNESGLWTACGREKEH